MKAPIHRIAEIRDRAIESGDDEVVWLSEYCIRLVSAAVIVADHLGRLSSARFVPRLDLERALRDERPGQGRG